MDDTWNIGTGCSYDVGEVVPEAEKEGVEAACDVLERKRFAVEATEQEVAAPAAEDAEAIVGAFE
jgi:hypothetical protein